MNRSIATPQRHGSMTPDRRLFLKGVVAAGASLAAPMSAVADETPKKGGHLVVGLTGGETTNSLDPTLANAQAMFIMLGQYSERLILPARNGRDLEARLAESWDHSTDLMTWTFKLRKGVTFHNGKTMTAKDAVFSLNRHRGANSKSGAAGSMGIVADIKADGDNQFAVTLTEPRTDFPFILTDYHIVVQPEGDPGDLGIGTGPYAINEAKHGVRYLTTKFKDYWQPNVGFVDSIETLVINDNSARVSALINGQVHLINRIEPKVVSLIARAPTARVVPAQGRSHYVFAMRTDVAPFDNADLRTALKLAIDRPAMVKQILRGYGTVGNDTPINANYPLATSLEQRTYDPKEAARLYKKSGHAGPIILHTSEVAFGGAVDAAVLFKVQAAQAGITIEVQRDPGDGYWGNVWNKEPFCATYWDGRPSQQQMLGIAYKSDAPWNETAWKRPAFDKLLADAGREPDDAKRTELYKAATTMVRDDGGAIIPMFTQYLDGVSNKVEGYVADPNNELSNARFQETCWLES